MRNLMRRRNGRQRPKDPRAAHRPVLFVDVDGVISVVGFESDLDAAPGPFHWIDGVIHCIPIEVGDRLIRLATRFELVWATGWEGLANQHLPLILNLPFKELPTLSFGGRAVFGSSDWKIEAISDYAGSRPAAWIDDNIDATGRDWAAERGAPTRLVRTDPAVGLTDDHVAELLSWADELELARRSEADSTSAA